MNMQEPDGGEPYWPRPEMRRQIEVLDRYIVTPETAEHRLFVWLKYPILPDKNLIVFPRSDDAFFGLLHSRFHELWSTGHGNRMGQGNQRRYNNTAIFDTFPFPDGMTPDVAAAVCGTSPAASRVAAAAKRLNELRSAWINPPELARLEPEVVVGFPDRDVPVSITAAPVLKRRTLTNLYNERPTWLAYAHRELDSAVAVAYGWPEDISDEDALIKLFALNQTRCMEAGDGA